jgi:hypothetical protein|nr:MAG: hypothetical protein DIU56_16140 [Pseudomonadota bacterium]
MTTRSSRRRRIDALLERIADLDPREVDRLYGLEPVFEPASADPRCALGEFVEFQCPWCGEVSGTSVDLTTGDRTWIEDCQVCCRPMQITAEVDERGVLARVTAHRED